MFSKKRKKIRASRLTLNQRSFSKAKGETSDTVLRRVLSDVRIFDFHNRTDLISAIAQHPKLPTRLAPIYGDGSVFHGVVNLETWVSQKNYIYWIIGIFFRYSYLLKDFFEARTRVSTQVLRGDAVKALQTLATLSETCESWWSIETAVHINKELLGNDTKGYIKNLRETYSNLNIAQISRDMLLLSESSSASLYIESVLGRIKEYQSSAIEKAASHGAVESCQLLPIYYDGHRLPDFDAFFDYRSWSLFDQYLLFRNIVIEMHIRDEQALDEFRGNALALAEQIGDSELNNILSKQCESDGFVLDVVQLYTRGDYHAVVEAVSQAIDAESSETFGLLEIYARAKIYTATVGVGSTFFDKLASELAGILMLDVKSAEKTQYLEKIAIKFRGDAWAKSLLFHLVSLQEWDRNDQLVEALRRQTLALGQNNTPKANSQSFSLNDMHTYSEQSAIPKHRTLKYADASAQEAVVDPQIFPIYSDYLKTQARHFIANSQILSAMEFCITEYLKNNLAYDYLPILHLCKLVHELDKTSQADHVSCLIIFEIYGRERDAFFDEEKTNLFEEFLTFSDSYQPSRIFRPNEIDAKTAFFLRNVCVPAQLDNIIEFANYDEVIHERVAIIDLLIAARTGNSDDLRTEKDKVLETLFSEKLRAKIESGKLYVDVQALETHRRHIYAGMYEQAKSLEGGINLEPLTQSDNDIDSNDLFQITGKSSIAIASSEKSSILVRIFMQAVTDFALDENYGLDKYLSAEVRHIVFVTQLRSCFEKRKLVTIQKNGEYLPNDFWIEKYNYVATPLVQELDVLLVSFSQEVDDILVRVNDRFRVTATELSSENVFDFCPYHDRVVRVSEIIGEANSFEDFFKQLIAFMWEIAVDSARAAQGLINDVLLVDVLKAMDELESEILSLKGDIAMVDLMQELRNARSDFKKEIELVLNWFRFIGSEDVQTFERLGVVIEATVSSFQSIFKHKGKELLFSQQKSDLLLTYNEAKSLFISLFTALENALRYGTAGEPVRISHTSGESSDKLVISNTIGIEIDDPSSFILSHKAKWTDKYLNLSTAEGGTGLYKIHNILKNASSGFKFDISIENSRFNSLMDLKHEYFNNRRQSA